MMNGSFFIHNENASSSTNLSHVGSSVNFVETIVSSLQALIIFSGSSLCLIAFARTLALRTPFNYYLISVVIAQVTLSFYELSLAIQHYYGHWIFKSHSCSFFLFIFFCGEGVVGNAHFLIAANRTWALYFPHHFRRHNTTRVTFFLCGSVWFATVTLVLPWVILNEQFLENEGPVYMCRVRMTSQHTYSTIIMLLFVSPTAFIITSYPLLRRKQLAQQRIRNNLGTKSVYAMSTVGATLGPTVNQTRRTSTSISQESKGDLEQDDEERFKRFIQQQQMEEERLKQKRQSNAFLVLTSIVVCAVVFWSPIVLYGLGEVMFPNSNLFTDTTYFALTSWLACSTCLDPIIFIVTVPLLRKQVRELLRSFSELVSKPWQFVSEACK